MVAVPGPSYATWVSLHELSGDEALETSNPARDGISNLMKYALRLDPNELVSEETDGVVPGKPAIIESGEELKFTFLRNAEASDLTYTVESCEDMTSWQPVTSGVSEAVLSDTLVKVEVLLPELVLLTTNEPLVPANWMLFTPSLYANSISFPAPIAL